MPPFLQTSEAEKPYKYVIDFFTRYFSQDGIGRSEKQGDDDPYFGDSNQYWKDFMEAMDKFGEEQLLQNLPLFYVYSMRSGGPGDPPLLPYPRGEVPCNRPSEIRRLDAWRQIPPNISVKGKVQSEAPYEQVSNG